MKLIRPFKVSDAALVSSNVSEAIPAAWDAATTYAEGDQITDPAGHRIYESLVDANVAHDPTDIASTAYWLNLAPTNRWAMFDSLNGTMTTAPAEIDVTVQTTGRVDSVALLNVTGASVQIISTDDDAGEIYNQTFSMVSTESVGTWFDYFFEEIRLLTDLVVTDLPLYTDQLVQVKIDGQGDPVSCGVCLFGFSRLLGAAQWGAGVGITDYSRKEADDFGNYTIVERAYSKTGSFTVYIDSVLTDEVQRILAQYRATAVLWVGAEAFASTMIYGFFRSFNIELSTPAYSICSLEVEGLT